jgi:putative ABC transport system permease protein
LIEIVRNMTRRKTRTGLTVFGIVIGVFALTVMGAMAEYFNIMLDGAERLTNRNIQINVATRSADDRFTSTTIQQLRRVDGVKDVVKSLGGILSDESVNVSFGPPDQVYAIEPRFIPDMFSGLTLRAGRWLDDSDTRATVVGSRVASSKNLTVGSTLTWRKNDYLVVGVVAETNTFPDGFAVMPFETVRRDLKFGPQVIGGLTVVPLPGVNPEELAARINREVPRVKAKAPKEAVAEIRQALATFNAIMIGGSLMAAIVGGLAVVNTMIMSVNERTREIGIKKAIGAENITIVREFLTEAALIGLIGGLGGLWFGWTIATLLNNTVGSTLGGQIWQVTPRLAIQVLTFAIVLGTTAGVYPAWFASRLQPVQALRAE